MSEKRCSKCGQTKPLTNFHVDKSKHDGLYPSCADCHTISANGNYVSTGSYQDIINANNLNGAEKLILVTLIDAVRVARRNGQEARNWLRSEDCRCHCDALDIDHEILVRWAERGYPKPIKARQIREEIHK